MMSLSVAAQKSMKVYSEIARYCQNSIIDLKLLFVCCIFFSALMLRLFSTELLFYTSERRLSARSARLFTIGHALKQVKLERDLFPAGS